MRHFVSKYSVVSRLPLPVWKIVSRIPFTSLIRQRKEGNSCDGCRYQLQGIASWLTPQSQSRIGNSSKDDAIWAAVKSLVYLGNFLLCALRKYGLHQTGKTVIDRFLLRDLLSQIADAFSPSASRLRHSMFHFHDNQILKLVDQWFPSCWRMTQFVAPKLVGYRHNIIKIRTQRQLNLSQRCLAIAISILTYCG